VIVFEWTIAILLGAVLLSTLAKRIGAPYPALLALGGAAIAFIPGAPRIALEPELALALFLAPVLLDAAYDTSPRDLRDNWLPVTCLVLVAVGLTTAVVAILAHALTGMPWAAAVALGAIVAPPDAAAATAVLRQVRLPHRLLTILEGESLLNDASALLIYRAAVIAALTATFSVSRAAPGLVASVIGSLILGPLLALLALRVLDAMRRHGDAPSNIIMQFITTFGVWLLADRIGLSGVLTVVSYAVTIARQAPASTPARLRVRSYAVWDTAVFVLNVLAFVLIGLQVAPIVESLQPDQRLAYFGVAGAVLATVILVRIVWVMGYTGISRWYIRQFGFRPVHLVTAAPSAKGGIVVAWCGMRGIVTLATALALPTGTDGAAFPYRDLIVLTAASVVLGTLVVQGLTLRPLLSLLDLHDDDPVGREVEHARRVSYAAAIAALDGDTSPMADALRIQLQNLLLQADHDMSAEERPQPVGELHLRAVGAARHTLLALRASYEIGDDAFHLLEEELDRIELSVT
jgi:CPA1 family monovalent cation:H+ antiporter